MKIEFDFHDAREELPRKSGIYLCCSAYRLSDGERAYITFRDLSYSTVHKLFNTCDFFSCEEAKAAGIEVDYWFDCESKEKLVEALGGVGNLRREE